MQAERATFAFHITCVAKKSLRRVEAGGGNPLLSNQSKRKKRKRENNGKF